MPGIGIRAFIYSVSVLTILGNQIYNARLIDVKFKVKKLEDVHTAIH